MIGTRFLLIIVLCATPILAQPSGRILGGDESASGVLKYVASVRLDFAHVCGGTIVSKKHVITAAHCVSEQEEAVDVSRVSLRVGSTNQFSGGSVVYVYDIDLHPNYKDFSNDIAILTLTTELTWTTKLGSIAIATSTADKPTTDSAVVVAGWGDQGTDESPYKLHSASYKVAEDSVCTNAFEANDQSIICLAHALKEGSCTGDAGNGGVFNNKLVAVSNFVIGACGSRYPDIYLNVVHYAEWINKFINY